jgi:hypothetical protein
MANHALRARTASGLHARYNTDSLSAAGGSMCIAFWVRFPIAAGTQTVFYVQGNNLFEFRLYGSGANIAMLGAGGNTVTWTGGYATIRDGGWHLVICESDYSGGAGNGVVRLWVDGSTVASATGLTWTAASSFSNFYVGQNGFGNYANGDIDEFVIFDGYLSEAEKDALYNAGAGVKPITDGHAANGTLIFRAGYDANSATADYAAGTAAPISGTYSFARGFLFGDTTWLTTDRGPDELWHVTDGIRQYEPDMGTNPSGHEDWTVRRGVAAESDGAWRITEDGQIIQAFAHFFTEMKFPLYVHMRMRTDGLTADTDSIRLRLTAPDSRSVGLLRYVDILIYQNKIQGLDANSVFTVDTEAWVDLKFIGTVLSSQTYQVIGRLIINDAHELIMGVGTVDPTGEIDAPALWFDGSSLTAASFIEIQSLGIHGMMQPSAKKTAHDTFPDELHLSATTNASRQEIDTSTAHPWTDSGIVWAAQVGTWSDQGLWFTTSIYDSSGDQLLIWSAASHSDTDGWPSPLPSGVYKYNIGYGTLDLSSWPTVGTVSQGAVVYRPDTPYYYPHLPGVIDDHLGRRMMVCTRYHLPDSPNFVGQCRGDLVVGELTDNTTFVIGLGGDPMIPALKEPSTGDTQMSGSPIAYNGALPRGMRYQLWSQAYGDRNTWGGGGASSARRGMFLAIGETVDAMRMWPSGTAMLPLWEGCEWTDADVRSGDDYVMMLVTSGSHYLHLMRGRGPMLWHVAERFDTFQPLDVLSLELVADTARGVWHCPYSDVHEIAYAYMRLDGFDWLGIDAGQTDGDVITVTINKPSGGWGSLYVNVDASTAGNKIEVAVLDPSDNSEIASYGRTDCTDITTDDDNLEVTWGSALLSGLSAATYRLRFYFSRTLAGDATPRLYSYRVADWPSVPTDTNVNLVNTADLWV